MVVGDEAMVHIKWDGLYSEVSQFDGSFWVYT